MQKLLKYWLATVVVILGTINLAFADLNDGLIACYGFEENANDTSSNALHSAHRFAQLVECCLVQTLLSIVSGLIKKWRTQ